MAFNKHYLNGMMVVILALGLAAGGAWLGYYFSTPDYPRPTPDDLSPYNPPHAKWYTPVSAVRPVDRTPRRLPGDLADGWNRPVSEGWQWQINEYGEYRFIRTR
jgi:hypothetical protein